MQGSVYRSVNEYLWRCTGKYSTVRGIFHANGQTLDLFRASQLGCVSFGEPGCTPTILLLESQ